MSRRPRVTVRAWDWRDESGRIIPGMAIFQRRTFLAHLTPAQALNMADKLVDLAEEIDRQPRKPPQLPRRPQTAQTGQSRT